MATVGDLRRIALSLPETTERSSYGTPGFFVRDKLFARVHDLPGVAMVRVPDEGDKTALIAGSPDVFFTTPHYDGYAGVLVRLPAIPKAELRELVVDAWRSRAPKRVLAAYDAGEAGRG